MSAGWVSVAELAASWPHGRLSSNTSTPLEVDWAPIGCLPAARAPEEELAAVKVMGAVAVVKVAGAVAPAELDWLKATNRRQLTQSFMSWKDWAASR